ncbi:hypothetical protein [Mucilaginibacter glaciei]|nr:hypothetical protein [Mucilaginibacter glaciei]
MKTQIKKIQDEGLSLTQVLVLAAIFFTAITVSLYLINPTQFSK